jgi:hypothetical protein
MVSPLRNPFDPRTLFPSVPNGACDPPAAERHSTGSVSAQPHLQAVEAPSSWHEPSVRDDALHREGAASSLTSGGCVEESEPSFRMSEGALTRLEAGLRAQEKKQVPRAGQLPPVLGLSAAESERANEDSRKTCNLQSLQPSPPLAPERLPLAPERLQSQVRKQRRPDLDVPLVVLIAGAIAVAIAYYFSTAGVTPELASIKAEPVELSPKPIAQPAETKVNNQPDSEENNQRDSKSATQAEAPPITMSTPSPTSIESTTPALSTTMPRRSHRAPRHSGNAARSKSP